MELAVGLIALLLLSIVVEAVVNIIKGVIPYISIGALKLAPVYSLVVGVFLAIVYQIDFMASIGFATHYALAGWILSGIVASGGSAFVHELVSKLRESRASVQTEIYQAAVTQGGQVCEEGEPDTNTEETAQ